jgi:hypothetical protein
LRLHVEANGETPCAGVVSNHQQPPRPPGGCWLLFGRDKPMIAHFPTFIMLAAGVILMLPRLPKFLR